MDAKSYLAELKSDLSKYDNMGLIDESSVYSWMEDAMRKFGKMVCYKSDCIVDIHAGEGCLPDDYYSFDRAFKCEPIGYTTTAESSDLQNEFAWKERTERGFRWNSCDECCKEEYECTITEKIYFKTKEVNFHYHSPKELTLERNSKACGYSKRASQCHGNSWDIVTVSGSRMYCHFDEGSVYLKYYAIVRDEEGLPYIYQSDLGYVFQFVDTYVKRKCFEKIFANGDDPNVIQKLQYYLAQEPMLERKAMGELKMSGLGMDAYERMVKKNRSSIEIYERVFDKIK